MKKLIATESIYDTLIRLILFLAIVAWCLLIIYPFVSILMWSSILALALHPMHSSISKKLGGKPKIASTLIVVVFLLILIIPASFLIGSLISEVKTLEASYENNTLSIPAPTEKVKNWPLIGEKLYDTWSAASENLKETIVKYKDQITETAKKLAKGIMSATGAVFQMIISFIIAGILLVFGGAGESIRKFLRKIAGKNGDEFADIAYKTVSSVVKGVLGVAIILTLIHGIIFTVAGIPYAGILTLGILVLSILQLPAVFISVPVIIYLFSTMNTLPAVIWTIVLIAAGLSDNFLKPVLLGKGAPVPMLVIFLGVIGGFILSGFIGLFTGAIVMSIGYTLFIGWMNSQEEAETENR